MCGDVFVCEGTRLHACALAKSAGAEFRGATAAVKSVVWRKLPWATLHLDNQGVLWGVHMGKAADP